MDYMSSVPTTLVVPKSHQVGSSLSVFSKVPLSSVTEAYQLGDRSRGMRLCVRWASCNRDRRPAWT